MQCNPPANSRILSLIPGSNFHDAWTVQARQPELSALGQFLKAMTATPTWVGRCMDWRNRMVERLGLKNLGSMNSFDPQKPAQAYQVGDRVGIFTLFEQSFDEVLLGDRDKHLDVVLSVHRTEPVPGHVWVTVTTVVQVHNWLGHLYMLPVKPMHRIIAPAVLRGVRAR